MGREVRKVPANWEHPKNEFGNFRPLWPGGYEAKAADWLELANKEGIQAAIDEFGRAPDKEDYMPDWPDSERTHYMMYEDTSEGTPISPAFPTPEELARWLADTGASSFGSSTATYDQWLRVARGAWAPSLICSPETGMISGVEAAGREPL
jgi:hypothetical protein